MLNLRSWIYERDAWHKNCFSRLTYPVVSLTVTLNHSENVEHTPKRWCLAILFAWEKHCCWNTSGKSAGSAQQSRTRVWCFTNCGENFQWQDSILKTGHLEDLTRCPEKIKSVRITRNLLKWEITGPWNKVSQESSNMEIMKIRNITTLLFCHRWFVS